MFSALKVSSTSWGTDSLRTVQARRGTMPISKITVCFNFGYDILSLCLIAYVIAIIDTCQQILSNSKRRCTRCKHFASVRGQ